MYLDFDAAAAASSAGRRALWLPEIVHGILDSLALTDRHPLSYAACANKLWNAVATDILWASPPYRALTKVEDK